MRRLLSRRVTRAHGRVQSLMLPTKAKGRSSAPAGQSLVGGRTVAIFNVCSFLRLRAANGTFVRSSLTASVWSCARYPNVVPSDPYRKGFLYARDGDEDVAISGIHNKDDWLLYAIDVPVDGIYAVWMCYGNGMHIDMGGRTSIDVDGSARVPLMHLPDTGGSAAHRRRARPNCV